MIRIKILKNMSESLEKKKKTKKKEIRSQGPQGGNTLIIYIYINSCQRPILKEIGLILNNKWIQGIDKHT